MRTALVPVKSAMLSKINWLQVVMLAFTFATGIIGAFNLDPVTTGKLTAGVAMGGQVLTMIIRTYFTTSVTPSAAPPAP